MLKSIDLKLWTLALVIMIIFVSCTKDVDQTFDLDLTPILSGGLGWAVVSGAYVRLKVEPGFGSRDGDYARRGEILRVVATERAFIGRDRGTWYKLEGDDAAGWLHQSLLTVHPSLERAIRATQRATPQATPQAMEAGQ
jgi:hypothetical protein